MNSLVFLFVLAVVGLAMAGECPNNKTKCTATQTCCSTTKTNTTYGCCPYPLATCCSDYAHCCPHDYTCDLAKQECIKNGSNANTALRARRSKNLMPARKNNKVAPSFVSTTCPDGSSCSSTATCCRIAQGYGCCPYSSAVCCSDEQHCCPQGYTCDVQRGLCQQSSVHRLPMRRL